MNALLLQASANALPLADESVQCVVTSPPYWGLRAYAGEQTATWADGSRAPLGLEASPDLYVEHMIEVFREVRRVLRPDGTLWLNLGDSYAGGGRGGNPTEATSGLQGGQATQRACMVKRAMTASRRRDDAPIPRSDYAIEGLPAKNLIGMPWRVAFALQADGWVLRSDIIWHKPNPMPESVTDRPTKAHEYLFLLAKNERYFYDREAILEPLTESSLKRIRQETFERQQGGEKDYRNGTNLNRSQRQVLENFRAKTLANPHVGGRRQAPEPGEEGWANAAGRNKRDVWAIATKPYPGAHFATFPEALVEPCIKAGSRPGDVVLDPFNGSGTTGRVAVRLGRSYVGVDISREYLAEQATKRLDGVQMEAAL